MPTPVARSEHASVGTDEVPPNGWSYASTTRGTSACASCCETLWNVGSAPQRSAARRAQLSSSYFSSANPIEKLLTRPRRDKIDVMLELSVPPDRKQPQGCASGGR